MTEFNSDTKVQEEGISLPSLFEEGPLGLPARLLGYTVNGTDSLDLPESGYNTPSVEEDWGDEKVGFVERFNEYKATKPPGGYYEFKDPKVSVNTRESDFYVQTAEGFEKVSRVRRMNTYAGRGVLERDGKVWNPLIRIRLSRDKAYAKNEDGSVNPDKMDIAYRLFIDACAACIKVMGIDPGDLTFKNVDEYLRYYPIRVQTMQTADGSLLVLGIQGINTQ
jgi:hypothetical protein